MLNECVGKAEIVGNQLKLIETGIGVTDVIVTARDRLKCTVNDQFSLAVKVPGDAIPKVKNQPEIALNKGFGKKQIDLSEFFSDDDGDTLVYTAKTDSGIVSTNKIG